jgi:uncharacterized membrane protein
LVDYCSVRMSTAGRRLATYHMFLNVAVVLLYCISAWLRFRYTLSNMLWGPKFFSEIIPFGLLGVSGWLGGKMSYQHKIGVVENYDPEATAIGNREGVPQQYNSAHTNS